MKDLEAMTIEQHQSLLQAYKENYKKNERINEQLLKMQIKEQTISQDKRQDNSLEVEVEANKKIEHGVVDKARILTTTPTMKEEKA